MTKRRRRKVLKLRGSEETNYEKNERNKLPAQERRKEGRKDIRKGGRKNELMGGFTEKRGKKCEENTCN